MSLKVLPLRVGPEDVLKEGVLHEISEQHLREALVGRDPTVSRVRAVTLLGTSYLPDKIDLLGALLLNAEEQSDLRRTAAIQLGNINESAAREALLSALGEPNLVVLGGIVKALGWIGDPDTYGPLLSLKRRVRESLAERVDFALRLIAHRHGLPGDELPPIETPAELDFKPYAGLPIEFTSAPPQKVRQCRSLIAGHSFGIPFEARPIYQMQCQGNEWMLFLHRNVTLPDLQWLRRRSIPAALAMRIEEADSYALMFLVLSEPIKGTEQIRITVCRCSGQPIFAGDARVDGEIVAISIRALVRPGAYPCCSKPHFDPVSCESKKVYPVRLSCRKNDRYLTIRTQDKTSMKKVCTLE
jgi:HEAT repeats